MFDNIDTSSFEYIKEQLEKVIKNNKNLILEHYKTLDEIEDRDNRYILNGKLYRFGKCFIVVNKFDCIPENKQKRLEVLDEIENLKQMNKNIKKEIYSLDHVKVLKRRKIKFLINNDKIIEHEKTLFENVTNLIKQYSI